jgi:hypothetical protein
MPRFAGPPKLRRLPVAVFFLAVGTSYLYAWYLEASL